jgi:hypothetical protein
VSIFNEYWEEKKHHPSKLAQEEQRHENRRTMQRSILAPIQPLGGPTDMVPIETSSNASRLPTSDSLVIPGTTMAVVPIALSTSFSRPQNARHHPWIQYQ